MGRTQKSILGQVKFEIPIKLPSEDTNWDVSYTSLEPRGEFRLETNVEAKPVPRLSASSPSRLHMTQPTSSATWC